MDDAEILITDTDYLVAQAELLLSGFIEFDENGFHITQKGYATVFNYLKKMPLSKRSLICLFFEDNDTIS